jgi:exopolysaccharide biosynthesis polyprenyl glycosylphosphotransferase
MAADAVALLASATVTQVTFGYRAFPWLTGPPAVAVILLIPAWVGLAAANGLYTRDEQRVDHSTPDDATAVFHVATAGAWLFFAAVRVAGVDHPRVSKLLVFWAFTIVFVLAARAVSRAFFRRRVGALNRAVVVGAGAIGQLVALKLRSHREYGVDVIGFIDSDPLELDSTVAEVPILGTPSEIGDILAAHAIDRVIIAFSRERRTDLIELIESIRDLEVQVDIVPRMFETLGPSAIVDSVEGLPLIGLRPISLTRGKLLTKRAIDITLSGLGLVVLSPLLLVIAIRIRLDSPGPVLYRHSRLGRGGKPFQLLKFRTMYRESCQGEDYGGDVAAARFREMLDDDPDLAFQFGTTLKLADDPRVTRAGKWLRRRSFDEFPQLVNVFKGDISLVGPRPITEDELERYGSRSASLLNIPPGVTGYWQINGRSDVSYEERIRLDMTYVGSWSVMLDVLIIAKTFRILMVSKGAY